MSSQTSPKNEQKDTSVNTTHFLDDLQAGFPGAFTEASKMSSEINALQWGVNHADILGFGDLKVKSMQYEIERLQYYLSELSK